MRKRGGGDRKKTHRWEVPPLDRREARHIRHLVPARAGRGKDIHAAADKEVARVETAPDVSARVRAHEFRTSVRDHLVSKRRG